jgi:glutathione S-transferase
MGLTIWGRMNSINVQKVVWAAEELGLAYERREAGLQFGLVDTPEYRAMNPNGLVPVIDDGGFVLWESNAIVRYLCARHGGGLWPADAASRALSDRWMDWQATAFYPAYAAAFKGLVRTRPEKRDHAAIEASRAQTEPLLALLDAHLATAEHLGGDFGIGDIALGPSVHRWLNMPVERQPRPHVEAWHRRILARPAAACFRDLPVT